MLASFGAQFVSTPKNGASAIPCGQVGQGDWESRLLYTLLSLAGDDVDVVPYTYQKCTFELEQALCFVWRSKRILPYTINKGGTDAIEFPNSFYGIRQVLVNIVLKRTPSLEILCRRAAFRLIRT